MQVWIVEYGMMDEVAHIWGIYSTEELARKVAKNKLFKDYDFVEITGYQVREEAK